MWHEARISWQTYSSSRHLHRAATPCCWVYKRPTKPQRAEVSTYCLLLIAHLRRLPRTTLPQLLPYERFYCFSYNSFFYNSTRLAFRLRSFTHPVNCLLSSKRWFHRHFDATKVGFSIITEKKGCCLCAIFNIIMTLFYYVFTTLSIIAERRTDYSKKQIEPCGFQNHRI